MSLGRQAGRCLGPLLAAGLVALVPGLVAVGTTHAAGLTYYVATSGTDNTCGAGQASSTPLRTIGFALGCAATDTQNGISTASSPDTIQVAAGTYSENLTVAAYVSIAGTPGQTTVNGGGNGTVVAINSGYIVTISGLTITGGLACGSSGCVGRGGGIANLGTLSLSGSTVSNNIACSGDDCDGHGAGIFNGGTLSLNSSTVSGNAATACTDCVGHGGGIASRGTLSLSNSTVSGNTACSASACSGYGGGIANRGTLSLNNSTVSGNAACSASACLSPGNEGDGGGIFNLGTLSLSNSAVRGNTAACSASGCTGKGGGIYNDSGSAAVTLTNDTITYNVASSGGGIYNNSGSPTLKNDTIKNNLPDNCYPGSLCGAPVVSA